MNNTPKGLIEFLVVFLLLAIVVAVGMQLTLNQMEEMRLKKNIEKQELMNTEETVDESENYYQEEYADSTPEEEIYDQTEDEAYKQEPEESNDNYEHNEFQAGQRFKVVDPYSEN